MSVRYIWSSGRKIDFDRAKWLMDRELLTRVWRETRANADEIADGFYEAAYEFALATGGRMPERQPASEFELLCALWSNYCEAHFQKYGESFEPSLPERCDA